MRDEQPRTEDDAHRSAASEDGRDDEGVSLSHAFLQLREAVRERLPLDPGDDLHAFEWRELRRICRSSGQVVEHDPSLWEGKPSGSEHNCRYLDGQGLFAKVTKANRAGWRVDFDEMRLGPATPLQYLCRLRLVNFYFGDDIRLVGVETGPAVGETRIATTQPSLEPSTGGLVHPTMSQLKAYLEAFGFEMLDPKTLPHMLGEAESLHFRRDNLWLFDCRPHNFVIDKTQCIPIDVIVQRQCSNDIDDDFYGIF